MNPENQMPTLSRFEELCAQLHDSVAENVARAVKPVADSTDPEVIKALLSEAVFPAVALIDRFMAELGTPKPDRD